MTFKTVWNKLLLLAALLVPLAVFAYSGDVPLGTISISDLPREARQTLDMIKAGGPFRYEKDGVVFGNYEGVLPKHKRGYYHEYTVKTPGARGRGARRIIVGGEPASSRERYYTADHYKTFKRIQE